MRYVCESSWFLCVSGCFWEWYWTRADDFLLVQLALVPGDRRDYRHMIEVLLKLQHFPWMLEVKLVQPRVFKAQFAASVLWLCFVHCSAERLVWESRDKVCDNVRTDPDHWLCSCWTPLLWHFDIQQHPTSAAKCSGATEPLHLCYRCRWSKVSSHVDSVEADILGWNSLSRCTVVVRLRQSVLSSLVSTKQNTLALLKPSQAHFAPLEVKSAKTKCVMDLTPFILQMQEMRYVCESSWFLCVSGNDIG